MDSIKERLKMEQKEKNLDASFRKVFLEGEGKIVLFDILENGHVFDPRFSLKENENLAMNAKRSLAFYILKRTGVKISSLDDLQDFIGE